MECCFCYVTAGSRDEALAIGRALVEERLAACANLIEGMTSVYRWRDTIQEDREIGSRPRPRRQSNASVKR
jgi:periplasmic divalent cation tolerance protein